jgi:glycosyl transferase, family 25
MTTDSTLLDYFEDAVVINLPERKDRRRAVETEFRRAGWSSFRFFPAFKFEEPAGFKVAAWRGCFLSHLACLHYARDRGLKNMLVFEDDIALSSSVPRLTPGIVGTIGQLDWDILYFGHEETGDIGRANSSTDGIRFARYDKPLLTAHFYAVNGRIISRLIEHFERNAATIPHDGRYGPMTPDGAYNTFRAYNSNIATYIAVPKLGWQRPSRSDLSPSRWDHIKPLRPLVGCLRAAKHLIYKVVND